MSAPQDEASAASERGLARRGPDRRALIKASIGAAAAWTAPVIIDSLSSPAAAASCPKGTFYVAYTLALAQLFPNVTAIGCSAPTGTNVAAATVGLSATFVSTCAGSLGSIAHIASNDGNCQPVKLTVAGCSCTITKVQAHIHNRGPNACPASYCVQPASGATATLQITAGAIGSTTITVAPNYGGGTICAGSPGIHWGSPDSANGYMLVQLTCT